MVLENSETNQTILIKRAFKIKEPLEILNNWAGRKCSSEPKVDTQKKRLELLFNIVPGGVSIASDVSCKKISHNPKGAQFLRINEYKNFSHSAHEQPQVKIFRLGKELLPEEMPIQRAAWFGEEITGDELEFIWEDGVHKTAIWNARPLYNGSGIITGAIATFEDITERKQMEETSKRYREDLELTVKKRTKSLTAANLKLKEEIKKRKVVESELIKVNQKITSVLDGITDIFYALDNNCRFTYVNQEAERYTSKTKEELIGKRLWEVFPQVFQGPAQKQFSKTGLEYKTRTFEAPTFNGKWYEYRIYPSQYGLSVFLKDISDRKHTEQQLLEQSKELRKQAELLDLTQDHILVRDMKDDITYWNKGAEKGYGWLKEEAIGKNCSELFKTQYPIPLEEIMKELLVKGFWKGELIKTRKDGKQVVVASSWALKRDEKGQPKSILEINTDITEKIAANKALQESERRIRALFNSMFQFMSLVKPDGTLIDTNQAMLDFTGVKPSVLDNSLYWEAPWWNISTEVKEKMKVAVSEAAKGNFVRFEADILTGEGNVSTIDLSLKPVRNETGEVEIIISEARDLAERKNFEREMLRLDRLNVIGQAAAGISHEIRNPLTTVRGFLQLLSQKDKFAESKEHFDIMIEELDRANSIITEFLSLAKDKAVKKEAVNLNTIIKAIYPLVIAEAVKSEQYIVFEQGDIPNLLLDKKEMRQLIINLIRNGLEAMTAGGTINIKTYIEDNSVVLAVQDQGAGIEQGILDKLGTPFLTTKDYGTGLGLAVSFGIAARHNAKINVETGLSGTTFYVRFRQ